jgi:hypothetical protein
MADPAHYPTYRNLPALLRAVNKGCSGLTHTTGRFANSFSGRLNADAWHFRRCSGNLSLLTRRTGPWPVVLKP